MIIEKIVGETDYRALYDRAVLQIMAMKVEMYLQKGGVPVELWYLLFRLHESRDKKKRRWKWQRIANWLNSKKNKPEWRRTPQKHKRWTEESARKNFNSLPPEMYRFLDMTKMVPPISETET